MRLECRTAADADAPALAALHTAVAADLTQKFGPGSWSSAPTARGVLASMRLPQFLKILIEGTGGGVIAGTLRLATRKPWAIDTAYFTAVEKPLYLTGMAVNPDFQRRGVGRLLLEKAKETARGWPADAIRLDAFDAAAGAGGFYGKCGFSEVARVKYKGSPLVYFELAL